MRSGRNAHAQKIIYPITTASVTAGLSFLILHLDMSEHHKLIAMGYASPIALALNILAIWGEPKFYYRVKSHNLKRSERLLKAAEALRDRIMVDEHASDTLKRVAQDTCEKMSQSHMSDLRELQERHREVDIFSIVRDPPQTVDD